MLPWKTESMGTVVNLQDGSKDGGAGYEIEGEENEGEDADGGDEVQWEAYLVVGFNDRSGMGELHAGVHQHEESKEDGEGVAGVAGGFCGGDGLGFYGHGVLHVSAWIRSSKSKCRSFDCVWRARARQTSLRMTLQQSATSLKVTSLSVGRCGVVCFSERCF